MFEFLAHIQEAAEVPVSLGLGPLAALGISLAGSAGGTLLNRLLGGEGGPTASQSAASQAQAEALQQDTRLRANLEQQIRQLMAGPRPPTAELDLRNPMDIVEFISQIAPTGGLNMLMQLVSGGLGTGAINSEAASIQGARSERNANAASIAQNLLFTLLNRTAGGGSSNPFNDPNTLGTGERLFTGGNG